LWVDLLIALSIATILVVFSTRPASAVAPSNDDITNAVPVPGVPYTDAVDTSEATLAVGDSDCGAATVWYRFTPETDGAYVFSTFGSDYDTTLAVLEGSPGSLTLLACNDDNEAGLQAAVRLDLEAGVTYYVQAGTCCGGEEGQVGPGGNLVFSVETAPPAFEITSLTVDNATLGSDRRRIVLSGTVTCTTEGNVYLFGEVVQRQGLNIAQGSFDTSVSCTNSPTTWTATTSAGARIFLSKPATVTLNAYGCDPFACDDVPEVQKSIKVKNR
jgi:hypothetical protein